jgi:adenylate kinase
MFKNTQFLWAQTTTNILSLLWFPSNNILRNNQTIFYLVIDISRVIVITGTQGVGKTTVATELASRLNADHINIEDLVKKENLTLRVDHKRDTLIADLSRLQERVKSILQKSNHDIILEGHYIYDVIPKDEEPFVFVLRRDPSNLKIVLKMQGYSERKISENLGAEALDVCLIESLRRFGYNHVHEIDVTYINIDTVVDEILTVLEGKKEMKVDKVDWLIKLEEEGKLEEFLSNMKGVEEC